MNYLALVLDKTFASLKLMIDLGLNNYSANTYYFGKVGIVVEPTFRYMYGMYFYLAAQ